jgi:hypothetical protein
MKIAEMIAVLEAAERGERIECRVKEGTGVWRPREHEGIDTHTFVYRIAPKKESLVEELRNLKSTKVSDWLDITNRAADRIEELERLLELDNDRAKQGSEPK